jgi:glycosyltransferase involved in cell wall biosynthesis
MGFNNMKIMLKRSHSAALLRDIGADLLFCPFTAITYSEPRIPTVCTIYDLTHKTYPEFFAPEELASREHLFIETCCRASAFAATSDHSREVAIRHGQIDPSTIRTIHLRLAHRSATPTLPTNERNLLKQLGLVKKRFLVYPANFERHKNHEMLLVAFGIACQNELHNDIFLVCPGASGARQDWLRDAARRINLSGRVLFPDQLSDAELSVLIANSAGMIFPSLYAESSLPIIEAMAVGIPIACSRIPPLLEIAADAALFFDPRIPTQIAQAMISLAEDHFLRAQHTRIGRRRALEFSDTERMAREYLNLFHFTLNMEKHKKNCLTGAHSDGWASRSLVIQVAPGTCGRTLEIEFFVPEWLPQTDVTVRTYKSGKSQGNPLGLARGKNTTLSVPVKRKGGRYEIQISPSFVPALSGHGPDQRELSVLLQKCDLATADGSCIELIPKRVSV